jgi:hypothetical protein
MTRHLIHWRVMALCTMVGVTFDLMLPSQHNKSTDLKQGHSKICRNLLAVAYRAKPLGILRCDGHDMPTVAPTIVRMATVGELDAKS